MKKLIFFSIAMLFAFAGSSQETFFRKTQHKTVKTLKRHEVRKIQSGHNMYYRENDKVYKTSRCFSGLTTPKDATNRKPNKHRNPWE